MKTLTSSSAAIVAWLLFIAAPVVAQTPGATLTVNPRIGGYLPVTDLVEMQAVSFTSEPGPTFLIEQSGSLAFGLGLELDLPRLPVDVRLNIDYAAGAEIRSTLGGAPINHDPPVETTRLVVVGDLMFRPLPKSVPAQPYVFLGGGTKRYDAEGDGGLTSFAQDQSDPTLHVGGGLEMGVGRLSLNAQFGDYISWADPQGAPSKVQHDLFVTVGFSVGLLRISLL